MTADDMLVSDPTPLPDDLAALVPRALEILACYQQGQVEWGKGLIDAYSPREVRGLLAVMANLAGGLLDVAYSCTDLDEEEWLPHFCAGLADWANDND